MDALKKMADHQTKPTQSPSQSGCSSKNFSSNHPWTFLLNAWLVRPPTSGNNLLFFIYPSFMIEAEGDNNI